MGRGLRTTPDAVRLAGCWRTPLRSPGSTPGRGDRPRNGRQLLRQRNRLAAHPGRRPRAAQPHGWPHAQVANQAAHQAMDRDNAPAEAGASRPAAADVPPAAGPEARCRHRNGPGLLDPRPAVRIIPYGPATIPAQPVRTGRAGCGDLDSGVHRRGCPPSGRAVGTDAHVGQGRESLGLGSSTRLAATILSRMLGISGNGHLFMEQNALHGSQDELPAILDFQARWPWPSAPWALRAAVPWPSEWDRRSRGL